MCELKQSEFAKGDCLPEESGQAVVPLREIGAGSRNDDLMKGNDDMLKRDNLRAVDIAKPNLCELKQSDSPEGDCFVVPPRNDDLLKGNDDNGKRSDDLLKRNEGKTPNSKPLTPNLTLILKPLRF
ncbi:hypothetical protein GCM10011413_14830 [Pedobacter psychrotolerans]|uniref:Uncharacterized protein n=1 Tax=Pedobacter psychrotolerans TaxID=1843235 RepID=A0ABQ1SRG3_9SPHI|nr:hypothetical protein GCM10011413_14830 [Pedobacter psychrotolerans]